jgi:uncharacterized CHY-type Zn-finger protein
MKEKLVITVRGKLLDEYTRCIHYHSPFDVIAIKFKCCGEYYPCYDCHEEEAGHEHLVWEKNEFGKKAVLCGVCKTELTISEYLSSGDHCPYCGAVFNSNCRTHYHLYFEI